MREADNKAKEGKKSIKKKDIKRQPSLMFDNDNDNDSINRDPKGEKKSIQSFTHIFASIILAIVAIWGAIKTSQ